ncbi:hypothetical protein [Streptomyces sp. CB02613]|uniref:hypothetical protein n=1 Tax=Streptomyces sp. CB02613 TaxID=2020328 RepID=UPI00131A676D|nr:hypothetical protein [Streptomyces sp. CB02613]
MDATPQRRPPRPTAPEECRLRAEDTGNPGGNVSDRLVWAVLAVAGELHEIRTLLARRR